MTFNRSDFVRVVKRITEASGYLDLDMPEQAIESLRCISNAGPFEAQINFLRGKALQQVERYEDAAASLAAAAKGVPMPFRKAAFEYLSACVKESSDPAFLAMESLGIYRGAKPSPTTHRFMA
ncbi:MAG: hypothetical protein FWC50_11440 [Planctomycetaceae bacterium]|nr:hypothetical protein [Planctomycetaceae bacterium]